MLFEHHAGLERDRTAEAVAHRHEALTAGSRGEVSGRGNVVHTAREVVGLAVADADGADAVFGPEALAEVVEQAVRRTE